jgi:hypothetical protein
MGRSRERVPSRAEVLDPIGYSLAQRRTWAWSRLEALARAKDTPPAIRLACLVEYLKRLDPVPSGASINAQITGPVVIRWESTPSLNGSSPSPTPLARSSEPSTSGSSGNGHARPSSSSTDALESL